MPDVGTLNIEITSNAEDAAKGLGTLATKLGSVKKNADGFDLSNVQTQITNIVNAVRGSEKTMASLGTLFNATATYFKAFGKITNAININTKPIEDLKKAFGEGIKTGNVGSQLNQLRSALEGEWRVENAYNAGLALSAIGNGAKDAEATNLSTVATNVSALAKALNEYADASERIKETSGAEGFKAALDTLGTYGGGGYVQGFKSMAPAVGEAVSDVVEAGIEAGAEAQQSKSPSKVYEQLGSYAAECYIEGIRGKISEVTAAVSAMVQTAISASEGKTAEVALAVSAAIKSAFSTALSGMDLSDVQKSMIQKTANLTADVIRGFAETTKVSLEDTAKISSDMLSSAMTGATSRALESVQPLKDGMQQFNNELQTSGSSIESNIDEGIEKAVSETATLNERLQMTNEELQEQLRIRKELLDAQNQARLESNYGLYRELYMSGEGDWKQQVPEMYGFTDKAIEENETYADALKATLQEVNSYVDQFIEKQNTPAGTLLSDIIDQANEAKLAMKSASESAAVLRGAPELAETSSGMAQVQSASQTMNSSLEGTKTATRVLTDDLKDLDSELKQKKPDALKASEGMNQFKFSLKDLGKGIKSVFPLISSLGSRLKNIIIRRTLTAALRKIVSGAKEGIQNVYQYSKAINGTFAPSMDSAASSIAQMKNALGAALAPVIQALVPVLQNVVSWFINLLNYANQFFALLNGQKTWTRALPHTTEAFGKQEKAAKKTGAAIKDLLADWDELNIIQSNTSGAGAGAGASTAEDYLSMFEEVNTFDSKVKDIVGFIKENFDTIKTVAEGIGAAILLWRLSEGFGHALGMLQKLELAAGLILVIDGVKVTAEAGRNLGKDFATGTIDWDNIEKAVRGVLETAFGAALISLALGAGIAPGFVLGLVGGLTILGFEMREGYYDTLYGDVHEDVDEIRIALEEGLLDIDAQAQIDVTKAAIKDIDDAESEVRKALRELEKNYPVGVKITPDNATDFKDKVQALVTATNTLIASSEEFLGLTVPATPEFSGTFVQDAWGNVSAYVTELGEQIGKELDKGINDNVKLEELKNKLLELSEAIVNAQKSSEVSARVGVLGSAVRQNNKFNKYDRETIDNYIKEYNDYLSEKMGEATGFAEQRFVETKRLIAGLETSIDQIEKTPLSERTEEMEQDLEEMKKQLEVARKELIESFGENGEYIKRYAKENYYDPWTQAGRELFGNDIAGALQNAMSLYNNKKYLNEIGMRAASPAARDVQANDKWVDYYLRKQQEALLTAISEGTGMKMNEVKELLENAGIDPLSMFDEDFVEQYRNRIISWLSTTDLSKDQKSRILSSVGLNIDDLLDEVMKKDSLFGTGGKDTIKIDSLFGTGGKDYIGVKTKDGFLFNDDDIDDLYKHLNWSLATAGFEGGNRTRFQNPVNELYASGDIETMQELLKQINKYGVNVDGILKAFEMLGNYQKGFGWTEDINSVYSYLKKELGGSGLSVNDASFASERMKQLFSNGDAEILQALKWGLEENGNDEWMKFIHNKRYGIPSSSVPGETPYFGNGGGGGAKEHEDISADVEKGTKAANYESENLLRQAVSYLMQLTNKNWTVSILPSTAMGAMVGASMNQLGKATGD